MSVSLLNNKTGFTTPWHCSVALMADGEWLSATMAAFKKDHRLEIVHENGRPSYFQERTSGLHEPIDGEDPASNQASSTSLNGHTVESTSCTEAAVGKPVEIVDEKLRHQPSTPANSCTDESGEVNILELARTLSYHGIKNEKENLSTLFWDLSILCWILTLTNSAQRVGSRR